MIVQFAQFSSLVQPSFWHELTNLKIDVLRLSDEVVPISASYSGGRSVKDRETGQEIALGTNLTIGSESFEKGTQSSPHYVGASGSLKNFNTIEDFKSADKAALFNQISDQIWEGIITKKDTSLLNHFFLITYADLKKYKYYYWFAFPAFVAKPAWEIGDPGFEAADAALGAETLREIHGKLQVQSRPFFLVRPAGNSVEIASVEEHDQFFANVPTESRTIGFVDPSGIPNNPGWPLRNLLVYLRVHHPSASYRVLCWRDTELPSSAGTWKSRFGVLTTAASKEVDAKVKPTAVGWEKNVVGKLGARVADLAPMMDPIRLANQAVDLNLKLMRWRILPALDLDKVASTKVLLLGAGTLGCYVARTLMGWGVRNITFVDSARVSFSNPVRQPLFEFEDCLNGGKPKAACAADALKKIFPGINATGLDLSIPMPGHPIPPASVEQTKKDVETLEKLFDDHDAIFLLMDSRESRWLPTVLGAAKGKIVMNAALGFDTFLVMRHGARASTSTGTRLGCYYCNDIVAPADSLTDRTLDQMCTVTRPGIASIAASTSVELLVSLLQHPDGVHAPPPPPQTGSDLADPSTSGSVLGLVPHQIRGFLAQFRNMPIIGAAYDRCTGCSETVLKAYETEGFSMMLQAFNEPGYLEKLTGLDQLYAEGDAALENVDWDDDEGDL
ncbi:E1-like protein-activating [Athelia psychrophila]|uniref:Ubiquitin-like modifier-activating enzyme ATG7 n=1 Tax=Athelia psychrophila TaxID=1759441 RepID=A0A166IWK0_9AGAM|nr:E1-like protein-activating [Fibularhizoctonia sp. CBS 109695]KZP20248.1 E1-like protein-activating [Fibularhizoctonia sp. CBS 109695]